LNYFIKAYQLGVTATPDRGDKRTLSAWFENIPFECTLIDLIEQGYLSRIRARTIPLQIDLSAVKVVAGDYSADDVGDALAPHLAQIAREITANYHGRKTLAFLPLIKTSKKFVEWCKSYGLRAEHVDGTDGTEHRQGVLARLASGETQLVSNAMLFTEGVDCPPVDCIIPLRPTKIRSLFAQQVGRGTRIHPGKDHLLILDFLWLTKAHNLIRAGDLVARDEEEAEQLNRRIRNGEDIMDEMEVVRGDHLLAVLNRNREKKGEEYDLIEFATSIGNIEVADFEPTMHWHSDPMSEAQKALIEKWGVDVRGVKNKGHASQVIDAMVKRRDNGLATYKQVRLLQRQGVTGAHLLGFNEASNLIDAYMSRWTRRNGR
jgi:superfamily II DNA or RNA helicase